MEHKEIREATRIVELIRNHRNGALNEAERLELERWLADREENERLLVELTNSEQEREALSLMGRYQKKVAGLERILSLPRNEEANSGFSIKKLYYNNFFRYSAAVVLVVLAIGIYLNQQAPKPLQSAVVADIAPGTNRAVLTLADGRHIDLEESKDAIVVTSEALVYNDGSQVANIGDDHSAHLNKITTPKGGQYQIILPDQTRVWLNAGSSLQYPNKFSGSSRTVKLTGEAYFEVSHNDKSPFIVSSASQDIKVLGTQFNVSAYEEESKVKTTLLRGSVAVSSRSDEEEMKTLTPGQQSVFVKDSGKLVVGRVDIEEAVAWKNGYFKFNDEPLESIMRKISRWYDVEIRYADDINRGMGFGGRMSRAEHISTVLETLELTGGVHFKIEGRRITVMK